MEQNVETLPSQSHVSGDLLVCQVAARLAPMLLQQLAVVEGHAAVDGFAHVVDGEQGDLHGGQGFHLYAGGADGFYAGGAVHKA